LTHTVYITERSEQMKSYLLIVQVHRVKLLWTVIKIFQSINNPFVDTS